MLAIVQAQFLFPNVNLKTEKGKVSSWGQKSSSVKIQAKSLMYSQTDGDRLTIYMAPVSKAGQRAHHRKSVEGQSEHTQPPWLISFHPIKSFYTFTPGSGKRNGLGESQQHHGLFVETNSILPPCFSFLHSKS